MEVALLVFLVYMAIGVAKRFSNARMAAAAARRLADGSDASEFFESADLPLFTVVASALGVSAPPTPWPAQAAEYLVSAYTKELAKYRSKALKETKTNIGKQRAAAALLSYEYSERMHGWLDLIVMLLNLAAFVGYAIFPVTYLVPQDTIIAYYSSFDKDGAEWAGNLLGDVMWTIEPALILAIPPVIARSAAALKDAEQAALKKKA
jgi:hypothetical protein